MVKIEICDIPRMYEALVSVKFLNQLNESSLRESLHSSGKSPVADIKLASVIPYFRMYGAMPLPEPLRGLDLSLFSNGEDYRGEASIYLNNPCLQRHLRMSGHEIIIQELSDMTKVVEEAKGKLLKSNRDLVNHGSLIYSMFTGFSDTPEFILSFEEHCINILFGQSGAIRRTFRSEDEFKINMDNLAVLVNNAVNAFYQENKNPQLTLPFTAYPDFARPE